MKTRSFAISMILKAVDQVTGPITGMGGSVAAFQKKVGTSALNVSNAWGGLGKNLAGFAMRAALAGGSVFALAKTTASYGDEVAKTSKKLGLSTDALQSFRYIGQLGGVSITEMDTALEKFTVNLGKSSDGSGIAAGALHALGLTTNELKKAGPDRSLFVLADAFKKVKDPSVKASIAMEIFGKSGVGMVNVLSGGSAEIEKYQKRAKELGIIMDEEATSSSEKFDDALTDLQLTIKGSKNIIGASLLTPIQKLVEGFTKTVVQIRTWTKENPVLTKTLVKLGLGFAGLVIFGSPLIKTAYSIVTLVIALGKLKGMISMAGGMGKLLSSFGPGAGKFLLIAIGIGLAAYMIYKNWDKIGPVFKKVIDYIKPLAPTVAIITAGLWAMNLAMNANPIGLIIIGITALTAGIVWLATNWDKVREGFHSGIKQISGFFTSLWDGIKQGASNTFLGMKSVFFSIADSILSIFGGLVKTALGAGASVGRFLGIDTTGLDNVIGKISELQSMVHGKAVSLNIEASAPLKQANNPLPAGAMPKNTQGPSLVTPSSVPSVQPIFKKPAPENSGTMPKPTWAMQASVPVQPQGTAKTTSPQTTKVDAGIGARTQVITQRQVNDSRVKVSFENLPRGTKVKAEKAEGNLQLDMGYAGASY